MKGQSDLFFTRSEYVDDKQNYVHFNETPKKCLFFSKDFCRRTGLELFQYSTHTCDLNIFGKLKNSSVRLLCFNFESLNHEIC